MAKRRLINSHVHSTGSDGKLTPEEMIKEAIESGISYLCFCDHYRRPEEFKGGRRKNKSIKKFNYEDYVNNIKGLSKKYKSKIEICFGTEVDWFEEFKDWIKNEIKDFGNRYDLIIGAIHYLKIGTEYYPIDATPELWEEVADKIGIKRYIKEYYKQLRLMVRSRLFDCIGHFDIIKIYNKNSELFDENEGWYKEEILKTLDEASKTGICIEINTHGFKKLVGAQYPSKWIIKEANKREIPITISSDAHRTGEVGDKLEDAIKIAKKSGYDSIVKFNNHEFIEIKI